MRSALTRTQYKSITSGHTGTLGEVSKQDFEHAFFPDADKSTDTSLECVSSLPCPLRD